MLNYSFFVVILDLSVVNFYQKLLNVNKNRNKKMTSKKFKNQKKLEIVN